jgi:hypothetical protein
MSKALQLQNLSPSSCKNAYLLHIKILAKEEYANFDDLNLVYQD